MVYLVTYDISRATGDYENLYTAIKTICNGDYQHPLESVWLINTSLSVSEVYNRIRPYMQDKDYLLITKMTNVYYGWLSKSVWEWLKNKTLV